MDAPGTARGRAPRLEARVSWLLTAAGLAWSGIALLDPLRTTGRWAGPCLALAGWWLARRAGRPRAALGAACALASAWSLCAVVGPDFRADSPEYFVYLPSLVFDRDLDFSDEWPALGYDQVPGPTRLGVPYNKHPVGPALLWSPFYLAAHAYVRADTAIGSGVWSADGVSTPYRRAAALGTLALVVAGAALLLSLLARSFGAGASALAVAAALAASPILYYALVVPTMGHGATFGVAAAFVWAVERARREPTLAHWTLLGALLGLLALTRWQAALFVVFVVAFAAEGLWRRTLRPLHVPAAGLAALVVFSPQMAVWKTLFGSALTMPQGSGFVDWSSPRWLDTLISADHGLFSWTPAMLLGFAGLAFGLRRDPLLHASALAVVAATTWVNGGVDDWAGGDAFGARRFDAVVPLLAIGLAVVLAALERHVRRRPLLAPAALVALLALWNAGFVASFRRQRYHGPVAVERVASDQGRALREAAQAAAGALFGAPGRALVYRILAGQYLYSAAHPGGRIDLTDAPAASLSGRWSPPRRPRGSPGFRWAYQPEACVTFALEAPFDFAATVRASAPRPALPQTMTLLVNGNNVGVFELFESWRDVQAAFPARTLVPGENRLCFRFGRRAAGAVEGPAAAIAFVSGP